MTDLVIHLINNASTIGAVIALGVFIGCIAILLQVALNIWWRQL